MEPGLTQRQISGVDTIRKSGEHLLDLIDDVLDANAAHAQQLRAASQAKSWFLANMSHELRTPLNAVLGYAQLLQMEPGLTQRQISGVDTIRKSGEHLLDLIDDVLDVARIESGKVELVAGPVDLQSLLSVVVDVVRVRAEQKGVRFVRETHGELPANVIGDEKRLRQILLNLLGNAVKFTDKGEVRFRVVRVDRDDADDVDSGVLLRFEVTDTGPGIAREDLETIFRPFEQVGDIRKRSGGTGLGLTISRQLVRLMGGDIAVDSALGEGSRFGFELRLPTRERLASCAPAKRAVTGYGGRRRTVLVVDDMAENRALMSALLGRLGFTVLEAENGVQGVDLARAAQPDLVVIDSVMPVMDGAQATRRLRDSSFVPSPPIIVVSASASKADREASLQAGADAFLPKPVDFQMLLHEVQRLLRLDWVD
jgi:signal transduction histidine kinase